MANTAIQIGTGGVPDASGMGGATVPISLHYWGMVRLGDFVKQRLFLEENRFSLTNWMAMAGFSACLCILNPLFCVLGVGLVINLKKGVA